MKKAKILNLEEFLIQRGLEYAVVIGPQWESEEVKGKSSEDRFYVLNSAIEQIHYVRSVWRTGEFSSAVQTAMDEHDRHETKVYYSHDMDSVKRSILAEGIKAYSAYVIKQKRIHGEDIETDFMSKEFKKIIEAYGSN